MRAVFVTIFVAGMSAMLGLRSASADPLRSTSTTVSCPAVQLIGAARTCTATVADTASGTALTPAGTVEFSGLGVHGFVERAECTLSAGSCQVTYTGEVLGAQTISARYGGDSGHEASSGSQQILVSAPIGPGPCCYLPRVNGQRLAKAKRTLHRFGYRVGRIDRAFSKRIAKGRVISETPRAGIVSPRYTKIAGKFQTLNPTKIALVVSKGKRHTR